MKQYLELLQDTLTNGRKKSDRTNTGTISRFGGQTRYDMTDGFPLVTTKKIHIKSVVAELLWMLSGSTNVKDLQAMGCTIWDEWADEKGDLGPIYGAQWRTWIDSDGYAICQINNLIEDLTKFPDDRGHIVSAWNVAQLHRMALRPCHAMFQCYCEPLTVEEMAHHQWSQGNAFTQDTPSHRLSIHLYQRSLDLFLGCPFNVASYSLLLHMLAQQCNMVPGEFVHSYGDRHVYSNHIDKVLLQMSREPRPLPKLVIKRRPATIFDYKPDDFEFVGYEPHDGIKAPVAV